VAMGRQQRQPNDHALDSTCPKRAVHVRLAWLASQRRMDNRMTSNAKTPSISKGESVPLLLMGCGILAAAILACVVHAPLRIGIPLAIGGFAYCGTSFLIQRKRKEHKP